MQTTPEPRPTDEWKSLPAACKPALDRLAGHLAYVFRYIPGLPGERLPTIVKLL